MTPELRSASTATRLVYCVALFSFFPGSLLRSSGWIGMTLGRPGGGLVRQFVYLLIAAAVAFRIYQVLRYRHALDAFVSNKFVATLRALCIAVMWVGGLLGLAVFFIRPLALLIFKTPGDSGIAFYAVGMFLALVSPVGWQACIAFEATRLIGNAQRSGPRPDSPYRWKQDGIVAAVLMTLFCGGAMLRSHSIKADLAHACKEDRITCVATVDEKLLRMASMPMGSPVRLVTNINSIRMQMHNGAELKWEVVEGVSNSLKVSGYEPSNEEALPVAVFVQATDAGENSRLEVRVTESGDEVARMTAVFSSGARLEKDPRGRLNLLVPLPPRSEDMIKGVWRDDVGDDQTIDQLFVFFRRAIGTEVEARESQVRIAATPRSVKRVDGGGVLQPPLQEPTDLACDGRLQKVVSQDVNSYAGATRDWPMMELRLVGKDSQQPMTYVHRDDRIVCDPSAIWIVHSVPIEPRFSIKRFSPEGILERFVEGVLPVVASNWIYGNIDELSLREDGGAVWFDRVEVKYDSDAGFKRTIASRETFKVQVPPN